MPRTYLAMIVLAVSFAAGATIYMAWLASSVMPVWMAAMGPLLLAATLLVHFRSRR
jgi:hypothetical protein